LLTVAAEGVLDCHSTWAVRFWVELSVYTPVAVNCCVVPSAMLGLAGVTWIVTRVAGVTVSRVDPETPPSEAVIVTEPAATPRA